MSVSLLAVAAALAAADTCSRSSSDPEAYRRDTRRHPIARCICDFTGLALAREKKQPTTDSTTDRK